MVGEIGGGRRERLERWRECQRSLRRAEAGRVAWALLGGAMAAAALVSIPGALLGGLWLALTLLPGGFEFEWMGALGAGACAVVAGLGWRVQMWFLFKEMDCRRRAEQASQEERELCEAARPEEEAERIERSCAPGRGRGRGPSRL